MDYTACIQKTLLYIEGHLTACLTLKDLADESGYSPYHFHRLFQALTGETVMEHVRRKKILAASRDLLHTGTSVAETAFTYGFDSHDVFTRAFRRYLGVTPSRYRQINLRRTPEMKMNLEEETQMQDYTLYEKMICSEEEKRDCFPLLQLILSCSEKCRKSGLLALESLAEGQSFFFRKTLQLVLEGVASDTVRNIMTTYLRSGNYCGKELLERVLILEGILSIQAGEHPLLLSERLLSYFGEDLAQEAETRILPSYTLQVRVGKDFIEAVQDAESLSASTGILEDPILKIDHRSLQRILREVPMEDIANALKGAGGKTVSKILGNLPLKTRALIIQELSAHSPVSPSHVIEAQNRFIEIMLRLRAEGEIK